MVVTAAAVMLTAACTQRTSRPAAPSVDAATPMAPAHACARGGAEAVASFPDPNLERSVRRALGAGPDEPLTCAAVAGLTSLHAPDARIADLTGIEALAGLQELYIYGNNSIRDVTPLTRLTALRDLNLARNEIEDITPLAELGALTSLSLTGNPLRDIMPLASLTGLTRLQVEHAAGVTDLGALSGLAGLTRLELAGNRIVDLTPLAGLTQLTWLSLEGNAELHDVAPIGHLSRLETLSLAGTAVTDLSPLAHMPHLSTLILEGTPVRDLGALIGLTHLSRIDLRGNRGLTDIQPLLFNTSLGRGAAVRLERTGVSCEDVAALRMKGVSVLAGCE
jgi:Leucine-rich repeat (LRR) protein